MVEFYDRKPYGTTLQTWYAIWLDAYFGISGNIHQRYINYWNDHKARLSV